MYTSLYTSLSSGQGLSSANLTEASTIKVILSSIAFKSSGLSWPGVRLIARSGENAAITDVTFYDGMTIGLDPAYDAGLMRAKPGFALYSRLIEDNGTDFSLQCLPDNWSVKMAIPIGLDNDSGGEVTFLADPVNMPESEPLFLVDSLAGKSIRLGRKGVTYSTSVKSGQKGTGRFYLLNYDPSGEEQDSGDLSVWSNGGQVVIDGSVIEGSTACLYDILGRQAGWFRLERAKRNILQPGEVTPGLYIIRIQNGQKSISKKLILN